MVQDLFLDSKIVREDTMSFDRAEVHARAEMNRVTISRSW